MHNENYIRKEINIKDVVLNVKNPRFEKVNSQEEAIETMINEYEEKIYNLAKHIVENGMNPTELSVVINSGDKYIMLDGNRRLTALKILHNPNLLNKKYERLKSKILELDRTNIPTTINVIQFESEEDANLWIKLKHTGENDGVGTVGWTALQQARFDNDRYPLSIQLIEYMESSDLISEYISKKIKNLSISSLERLLGDPDVRNILSIKREKNELYFPVPNKNIKNILNSLLTELLSEDFTVNKIRNKSDRAEFMDYFKKKYNITDDNIERLKKSKFITAKDYKTLEKEVQYKNRSNKDAKSNKAVSAINKTIFKPEVPSTKERHTLIPKDLNLVIKNKKINDIYKELKEISVDNFPNVVGASFRVFLELSIDYYIQNYKNEMNIQNNDHLNKKLEKVKDHISNKLKLDRNELKEINRAISSNDNIVSIDVLHGYIHSQMAQASADGLKTTWNNYETFFKLLYRVLNDLSLS